VDRSLSRITGVFYLLNIATILIAIFLFRGIIVPGNPSATAANLVAREMSYRSGFALQVISTACSVVVAGLLYELLRSVNVTVSLLAAFFRLLACAVAAFGYVLQSAPLELRGQTVDQAQSVALLLHRLHGPATNIVIVFFGFHFILIGYLVFKSGFLPRIVGAIAVVAGLGGLVFLAPSLGARVLPYFAAVGLIAELSLTISLLAASR
jgi:uncharacterized protein DUF4386